MAELNAIVVFSDANSSLGENIFAHHSILFSTLSETSNRCDLIDHVQ